MPKISEVVWIMRGAFSTANDCRKCGSQILRHQRFVHGSYGRPEHEDCSEGQPECEDELNIPLLSLSVKCPLCASPAGELCRSLGRAVSLTHDQRQKRWAFASS